MTGVDDLPEAVRRAAADWFARLRAPDGADDRVAFEAWLDADPRHGLAYRRLIARWDEAALLSQTDVGRRRQLTRRLPFLSRRGAQVALAALLAAILCAGGLLIAPERFGFAHFESRAMATRRGEIRRVPLTDGSVITLDTNSAIDTALTRRDRVVTLLRGRARFDVAHEATRPFRVSAGGATVTAHGTVFDVSLSGGAVNVVLLRGAVDVRPPASGPLAHGQATKLLAGQAVAVIEGGTKVATAPAPRAERWTTGMLDFDDTPLRDVVATANRYGSVEIRLADPALGALRVTGAYRATDTKGLATSLAASLALQLETLPSGDFVLRAAKP